MSRLYLSLTFCLFSMLSYSQTEFDRLMRFGKELFNKGDYHYALEYFENARTMDSNSVEVLWYLAETSRAYKDYRQAEVYYKMVFDKEETLLYETSLLQFGLMLKMNGKYEEALEIFKKAKKIYARDKKGYPYSKSKKEIESCLYAKSAIENSKVIITPYPGKVNTKDSEFGHTIFKDGLIFSSMKADSVSSNEEVYSADYRTKLYRAKNDSIFQLKDLNVEDLNAGNGSFSLDGKRFYYSLCNERLENYTCKIMVAQFADGKWSKADELGEIINAVYSNTTMPHIAEVNGEEVLFFASDRDGGKGGMDLYYSEIKDGNQYGRVKNIKALNTPDNELSPFVRGNRLYFSSSWHDGLGGYDVFYSEFEGNNFNDPVNLGLPLNSSANDLYFFQHDSSSYVSSNRMGVLYSKNPTCCSDIFKLDTLPPPIDTNGLIVAKETLEELNKRLPVTLYFHNDEPNPRTRDTTTKVNYMDSYTEYRAMLPKYQKEYSSGLSGQESEDAKEDIETFFQEYVDQGVKDLYQFRDLLLEALQEGKKIQVTIKGFASPLAKSDYNVNLTKRRIYSLQNYLMQYNDSVFAPYFFGTAENGGELRFKEVPFGEYEANKLVSDNLNDQKNSVYSRAAGLERKIEVQSVEYIRDSTQNALPEVEYQVIDLGKIDGKEKIVRSFTLKNPYDFPLEIDSIRVPCHCSTGKIEKMILQPGESTEVEFTFDPEGYEGNFVRSIYIRAKDIEEELRLVLTGEIVR